MALGLGLLGALTACGGPGPAPPQPAAAPREAVIEATRDLVAALRLRDGRADALRRAPGGPCEPVLQGGDEAVAAWGRLRDAWGRLRAAWPGAGGPAILADLARQEQQARDHRQAWAAWCAGRPPIGAPVVPPMEASHRCGLALQRGAVINWVAPDGAPLAHPRQTAALLAQVAARFAADWQLALILDPDADARAADAAVLRVSGRAAAVGADPRHVSAWPALLGAAVYPTARLAEAAVLRGILRVFVPPTAWPGCDGPALPGWGAAEVGGQLGGARPGGIAPLGDGRWALTGPGGRPAGRIGSGGDAVPYAPLELAWLGLAGAEGLAPIAALRAPRWLGPGQAQAAGRCLLPAPAPPAGRALPRPPWRIGLIVRSRQPLPASALAAHAEALAQLAAPGPDPDPGRLNFFEATGGRGGLRLAPAARRACPEEDPGSDP